MAMPDIPMYVFTGFLESGKTKFIQETLEDNRFHKGERTLLLLCEEGEEVYEPDKFCAGNVFVRNIDEESDLTVEHLKALQDEGQSFYGIALTLIDCFTGVASDKA